MRHKRTLLSALWVALTMLVFAPSAFATTHAGQGIWGPTNDVVITNAMFIVIAFFGVTVTVFSLLQGWLEHRKHARQDAAKRRASSAEWKGGW